MPAAQVLPFEQSTRLKIVPLPTMSKPTGGGTTQILLPQAGILQALFIPIIYSVAGTVTGPNALGLASIIKRIQLSTNTGQMLIDISGAGYHYLAREAIDLHQDRLAYTNARTAVGVVTNTRLDLLLPIAVNNRDQLGLLLLQTGAVQATLSITWEADNVVATGGPTVTATAYPRLKVLEPPSDERSWPQFNNVMQTLEVQEPVSGAGNFDSVIPLGAIIFGIFSLFTPGYTASQLISQGSNYIEDHTPESQQMRFADTFGRDMTLSGALTGYNNRVFYDFAGSDGLGEFGTVRDTINTLNLSRLVHRINAVGAGTLYTVRKQLAVF